MEKEKTDRRIQRTRQLIHEAMMALILEKGYEKITIQDILDRANIGRSTFYAHYRDKEDLLLRGIAEIAYGEEVGGVVQEESRHHAPQDGGFLMDTTHMFTHVKRNQLLHKVMTRKSKENPILEQGTAFLYANTKAQLQQLVEEGQKPSVPIAVLAQFLTGGLMALIRWWVANDVAYSPEEMNDLFQKIAMPGVREVLGI